MYKDRNLVDPADGLLPAEDEYYAQSDKSVSITASGTSIKAVTVLTYDATTNIGTGTVNSDGSPITYTNGTGYYLVANDVVAVATDTDGNNVAVAMISRAGQITPGVVPGVTLASGYPKQTDSTILTYPIQGSYTEVSRAFTVDITGLFGYNTEALIGSPSLGGVAVNGINTVAGTNFSLGSIGSASASVRNFYTNPSGVLFVYESWASNTNMFYRNKSTDSFHTLYTTTTTNNLVAFDDSNGALWYRTSTGWARWLNGDTSGTATTLTGTYSQFTRLVAGNGYLFGYDGTNSRLYRKTSGGTDDWAVIYTGALTSGTHYAAGPDGKLYVIFEASSTVRIERYSSSGVELSNTGIDGTLASGYVRPMGLVISNSGIPYFTLMQRADLLTPAGTSSQYGIGLYACNFTGNTYSKLAANSSLYQSTNATYEYANGLQIYGSKIFWINGFQGIGLTTTYKIEQYIIV